VTTNAPTQTVFEELSEFFPLKSRTPPEWTAIALSDMDAFMLDHAFCERKAAATAMSLLMSNPDKPDFCEAMIQLSLEELEHFQQVFRLLRARGIPLRGDIKDPYVNALIGQCRKPEHERFLDRLLCFGIVEARGCERFGLIGQSCADPALARFYDELARAEARHFGVFLKYARKYHDAAVVETRLNELLVHEARVCAELPWRASLH
jgi:tRNA-(ms[2]io[6]A)-hydroxylase